MRNALHRLEDPVTEVSVGRQMWSEITTNRTRHVAAARAQ